MKEVFNDAESTEFSGKVVVQLAQDRNIMKYTSRIVIAEEYAQDNSIVDIDGRIIYSFRQLKKIVQVLLPDNLKFLSCAVPGFLKVPKFLITLFTSKF